VHAHLSTLFRSSEVVKLLHRYCTNLSVKSKYYKSTSAGLQELPCHTFAELEEKEEEREEWAVSLQPSEAQALRHLVRGSCGARINCRDYTNTKLLYDWAFS
jgi:hypothetical protein